MKTRSLVGIVLLVFAWLALPGSAYARGVLEDEVVFGGSYTLESDETLTGSLLVFGGTAQLEENSRVQGDVILMGGIVEVSGVVDGNILALGGLVSLTDTAFVSGDIATMGARVDRSPGARIEGEILNNLNRFSVPLVFTRLGTIPDPLFRVGLPGPFNVLWFFARVVLWAALAILVILFLPQQTERVSQAVVQQPWISGGLGLLTAAVLPPVLLLLVISICLIPVSLIIIIIVALAWAFGLVALGYEVGKRLTALAKQEWAPAVSAGLGTFLLILVLNASKAIIPCVGWILPFLVGVLGFGAVLLTRFGTQAYPAAPLQPSAPAAPISETISSVEPPGEEQP